MSEPIPFPMKPPAGRPLTLRTFDPWPEAIAGADLLSSISDLCRRYVIFPDRRLADAVALWTLAVHSFDCFTIFPRLFIQAPEKRSGKTTLLSVVSCLVPRVMIAHNITPAALFRVIEAHRPTLLLDEADTYMRRNEELRCIIDAGHSFDGAVIRTVGENYEPHQFSAWAPVALAAIGHLPGTIEDRSIIIMLRRRLASEAVETFRANRIDDSLGRKAARFAQDNAKALREAEPHVPEGIYNRDGDNWRPLFAIADAAGGDWPRRARAAARFITNLREDEGSILEMMLADIRDIIGDRDRISSNKLEYRLCNLEGRPWPEYKGGKPITKNQIARKLKEVGVKPDTIRFPEGLAKGYWRKAFEEPWKRYLSR